MRSRPLSSAMSRPSKAIVPAVGCSIFKISLAVVVLPHPDSPMSPSVSPAWMAKSTPSTAFTQVAPWQDIGTARMEVTAGRQVGQVGWLARDRIQRFLAAELRHRADQGARVRMLGGVE